MQELLRRLLNNQVFLAALGVILLYCLLLLKDILMLLFIAFILVTALHPFVSRLKQYKIPAAVATLVTVLLAGSTLGGLCFLVYYGLSRQIDDLSLSLNDAVNDLPFSESFRVNISLSQIVDQFFSSSGQLFTTVTYTIASIAAGALTVLVITMYWLSDFDKIRNFIVSSSGNRERTETVYRSVEQRIGGWVRGQLLVSLVIGLLTYAAYSLIGLPAARALAIIAALLEIIPTLGPLLAAVPAVLIALTISPHTALLTLAANLGIQQLENHLVAPKIFQYTVKLHPIVIIVVLYAGSQLAGLMGILLAVPATLLITGIHEAYRQRSAAA